MERVHKGIDVEEASSHVEPKNKKAGLFKPGL